jgi:G protein-coupled receptor GPR1
MCDFGKAVVLLWYPARVLLVPPAYDNINFCQVVGFFTSAFIEGADLAVLVLAIHTALLIFRKPAARPEEGGLYRYRYYVYAINFLLPILMAALAFINKGRYGYAPLITWCYLPVKPYWYRLVLSWIPRYFVFISILSIYISIYIYVKLEYRKVVKDYKKSHTHLEKQNFTTRVKNFFTMKSCTITNSLKDETAKSRKNVPLTTKNYCMIIYTSILQFLSYFPGLSFLDPDRLLSTQISGSDNSNIDSAIRNFQKDSMAEFKQRRNMIERQIRSIFLYPIAYLFLWVTPFIVHVILYRRQGLDSSAFWICVIASFMQPFNCVVDSTVFCILEKPWRDREERVFTKAHFTNIKAWFTRLFNSNKRRMAQNQSTIITSNSVPSNSTTFCNAQCWDLSQVRCNDGSVSCQSVNPPSYMTVQSPEGPIKANSIHHPSSKGGMSKIQSYSLNSKASPEYDPFASTARRVEFSDGEEESEGEIDLLEFLR